VVVALGIAAPLAFLAYAGSFGGALVRDAVGLVQLDARVRELSAENLRLIASTDYWRGQGAGALYRPLTTLSFLVNYAILGNQDRPLGYHVVNFLLHLACAALVYGLARRLTARKAVGVVAAAVFAVHPIATEAVTNVAGRADLLAAAAVLAVLYLWAAPGAPRWGRPLACGLLIAAGLLAKESAVVIVPLVVLLDVLRLRGPGTGTGAAEGGGAAPRLVPWPSYVALILAVVACGLARRAALAGVVDPGVPFVDNPLRFLSFVAARLTALKVVGAQLAQLTVPWHLSADYSYDEIPLYPAGGTTETLKLVLSVLAIGGLVVAAVVARRRVPAISFFLGWVLLGLLPTSNLLVLIGTIRADRFLYLPSAGLAVLVAMAWHVARTRGPAPSRSWVDVGLAVLVIAFGVRTYERNRDWRDDEALFRSARAVCPRSYRVHKGLAQALLAGTPDEARLDEAIAEGEEAARILKPLPAARRSADALLVLGTAYAAKGEWEGQAGRDAAPWYRRARVMLERAVESDPGTSLGRLYEILGNVCLRLGDARAALSHFATLRRREPGRSVGYMLSAWTFAEQGRVQEAAVMTLAAWMLDQRPDARSVLEELYRRGAPGARPFRDDGALDLDSPRVREDHARACALLQSELGATGDAALAARIRSRCGG
jgi:4-amino-4-deoxy-L-arabinose transferase-like glycosyltransferase